MCWKNNILIKIIIKNIPFSVFQITIKFITDLIIPFLGNPESIPEIRRGYQTAGSSGEPALSVCCHSGQDPRRAEDGGRH